MSKTVWILKSYDTIFQEEYVVNDKRYSTMSEAYQNAGSNDWAEEIEVDEND